MAPREEQHLCTTARGASRGLASYAWVATMGLINVLLKLVILVLDMRETYESLNIPRLNELGQMERTVRDSKEASTTRRRRVGGGKRRTSVRTALTTILVWNIFHKLEPVCDNTLAWFVPFYDSIKTLFLVWLLFTRSFGAAIMMTRVIAPIVRPYEGVLAGMLQLAGSLEAWTTATCFGLADRILQLLGLSSLTEPLSAKSEATDTQQPVTSTKKPPPTAPSSDLHAGGGITGHDAVPRPKTVTKKASSSALRPAKEKRAPLGTQATKARKVLQDLPVPTHQPAEPLVNEHRTFVAGSTMPANRSPEPLAPTNPGPPPSSPGLLKNFAFIPGQTPPQARPSIISPTPQFPGGFGSNPFQAARIPVTSSMPPLAVSRSPTHTAPAVFPTRPPPAHDDKQVVPPPTLHSKASSTALRRRKPADVAKSKTIAKSELTVGGTSSSTKKRTRDETTDSAAEAKTQCPARKKAKADANGLTKATVRSPTKPAAKRATSTSAQREPQARKTVPSVNKISGTAIVGSQPDASPPKTRLTRSRTRQHLVE